MKADAPTALDAGESCPLDGIRVLDVAGEIGAYCTKLLADLGADVIKVEPPGGDAMRRLPPRIGGDDETAMGAVFASYHANKRGVTLDVSRRDALMVLEALGAAADIVVVSPTRRTPVAGFDRDTGHAQWAAPGAIVASITPFGLVGPMRDLRATPFVSFAMGGGMHWTGHRDGPPLAAPGQLAWDEAGIHVAFGIVSALFGHARFGGQTLDFAVHDVAASKDFLIERFDVGAINEWGRSVEIGIPPSGRWECRDGLLRISAHQGHHWGAFLAMMDHPDELSEPSLADPQIRREIFDGLQEVIARLVKDRSRDELVKKGQAAGLPCAPVNDPGDFVRDEQPLARELFVNVGETGEKPVRIPWRWCHSNPPMVRLRRPAPRLGEHNREVYVDGLGFTDEQLESWKESGLV
jgi:crotonobetainyl-CoA:carnitine CoA-transferase CaiB-like acyl-CoA transferase